MICFATPPPFQTSAVVGSGSWGRRFATGSHSTRAVTRFREDRDKEHNKIAGQRTEDGRRLRSVEPTPNHQSAGKRPPLCQLAGRMEQEVATRCKPMSLTVSRRRMFGSRPLPDSPRATDFSCCLRNGFTGREGWVGTQCQVCSCLMRRERGCILPSPPESHIRRRVSRVLNGQPCARYI